MSTADYFSGVHSSATTVGFRRLCPMPYHISPSLPNAPATEKNRKSTPPCVVLSCSGQFILGSSWATAAAPAATSTPEQTTARRTRKTDTSGGYPVLRTSITALAEIDEVQCVHTTDVGKQKTWVLHLPGVWSRKYPPKKQRSECQSKRWLPPVNQGFPCELKPFGQNLRRELRGQEQRVV